MDNKAQDNEPGLVAGRSSYFKTRQTRRIDSPQQYTVSNRGLLLNASPEIVSLPQFVVSLNGPRRFHTSAEQRTSKTALMIAVDPASQPGLRTGRHPI